MSEVKFSPGTAVEVIIGDEDSPDIWYPATVIKETHNRSFMVKYKGSNEAGDLTVVVDGLHIRPSPPACVNTAFQLLEKVDAFCNFGWSSGVVTKVLSEGRYIVYFKRTKKEKELRHADLRLPMMQVHGKWVHSSQDDAEIPNPQEDEKISHGDNGKNSVLPEKSGVIKENKEVRKGQQERAKRSGKASSGAIFLRRVRGEVVTNNGLLDIACSELKAESVLDAVQLSFDEHETQMTPTEQLDQPDILEVPIAALKVNTCVEKSENGNLAHANSASPGTRAKRKRPGRPLGSESGNSEAGFAPEKRPVADSLEYTQKPIVISLPCYNSQWNKLQTPNTSKLPVPNQTGVQMEKKQLPSDITEGSTGNDLNHGSAVSMEVEGLNKGGSAPKRKRGRPFGTFRRGRKKVDATVEMLSFSSNSTRRSTRERREVYKSVNDTLKPKEKQLRPTDEIISFTQDPIPEEQVEGVITCRIREYDEPISHVSGNLSEEDMPLSTWLGEVHMLPYTRHSPGGNASISGNFDVKVGQVPSVQCNQETTNRNNVDVAQTPQIASQQRSTNGQIDEENPIDVIANGLPFVKASPIWKVIESMEVFQQIPQNPHFQPLYSTKEHCREGLAICSMVTFSRLAEDVSKFQIDDPSNTLEDSIETLSELEKQGFNVEVIRSRLNALLSIKRQHEPSQNLAKEITEEVKERAKIHQELDEIDKKMAELREKRASTVLEWQKRDSKIGGLQLRFNSVKEAMEAARNEFHTVATAPWSS